MHQTPITHDATADVQLTALCAASRDYSLALEIIRGAQLTLDLAGVDTQPAIDDVLTSVAQAQRMLAAQISRHQQEATDDALARA